MTDTGHAVLVAHLDLLAEDAHAQHFHDFAADVATPKMYLVQRLEAIIKNAKEGMYDN